MVGIGLISALYALEYLLLLAVVFAYMPAVRAGLTRVFGIYFYQYSTDSRNLAIKRSAFVFTHTLKHVVIYLIKYKHFMKNKPAHDIERAQKTHQP